MHTFTSSVLPDSGAELNEDRLAGIIGGKPKEETIVWVCIDRGGDDIKCTPHRIGN